MTQSEVGGRFERAGWPRGFVPARVALAALVLLAAAALVTGLGLRARSAAQAAQATANLQQIVIALHVYESGRFRPIPPIDWGDGQVYRRGLCFDKPALDPQTGRKIGEVTECFVQVEEHDGAFEVRNVSFINLPQGTIVAKHESTLQPVLDARSPATHVIGAAPPYEGHNVIEATGRFRGMKGRARIMGLLNLEHFRPGAESGIKFVDWIYLIQLGRPGS